MNSTEAPVRSATWRMGRTFDAYSADETRMRSSLLKPREKATAWKPRDHPSVADSTRATCSGRLPIRSATDP